MYLSRGLLFLFKSLILRVIITKREGGYTTIYSLYTIIKKKNLKLIIRHVSLFNNRGKKENSS